MTARREMPALDVVIVGAGPAGIGLGLTLEKLGGVRYAILEAGRVGESFHQWPVQTRFITPSFHSNPFGLADLNAVNELSSPAIFSGSEHPGGKQYADYLAFVANAHDLPIIGGCRVEQVARLPKGGFAVETPKGVLRSRFLVWATGEYQFPDLQPFAGAQWCRHYAKVVDWRDVAGPACTVIGGYESGVDAAVTLVSLGGQVRLLARKSTWDPGSSYDPSLSLSPHSRDRLYAAMDTGRLKIVFGTDVNRVEQRGPGFRIIAKDGRHWDSATAPILGTGFLKGGGARQIAECWEWNEQGRIVLSENDESTVSPGLFLVGPQVRQEDRIYCFVYKFRQRFGKVAGQIAARLRLDASGLATGSGNWGPFGNSDCCEGCEC